MKSELIMDSKAKSTTSLVTRAAGLKPTSVSPVEVKAEAELTITLVKLANSPTKPMEYSPLTLVVRVSNNLVSRVIPLPSTVQLNKILANKESL